MGTFRGSRDDGQMPAAPRPVEIRDEAIRLGQLLQLAGIVDSGSDAKMVLLGEDVAVNGEVETRRGRQLRDGDVVEALGEVVVVVSAATD
jgi:ribosome-associated protein